MNPTRDEFPHLRNAPITEALIDIQVDLDESVTAETLLKLHDRIRSEYPGVRSRHRWQGQVQLRMGEKPDMASEEPEVDGYLFVSGDGLQVVQYRLDGFTFSRLRPYINWEHLRAEARKLWTIYRQGALVSRTKRIAVRNINQLELASRSQVVEVLTAAPRKPEGFIGEQSGFIQRQFLEDREEGCIISVTQAQEAGAMGQTIPLWIDIDAFQPIETECPEQELWDRLDRLATVKNRVFFGLLTPSHVETLR